MDSALEKQEPPTCKLEEDSSDLLEIIVKAIGEFDGWASHNQTGNTDIERANGKSKISGKEPGFSELANLSS